MTTFGQACWACCLGGRGPTFAALIVSALVDEKDAPERLFAGLFCLRIGTLWYAIAFLDMPYGHTGVVGRFSLWTVAPEAKGFAWLAL
ncbi:MAG: hypothetical protein N2049_00900 [Anaerolineales bacterium]|nr:hypothetical protein [Anaerolineales bacterium]